MTSSNSSIQSPQLKGFLAKNQYKKEGSNQPDYRGTGSISLKDFMELADLITADKANLDNNGDIKLVFSAWKGQSAKSGQAYLRIRVAADTYKKEQPQQSQQFDDTF